MSKSLLALSFFRHFVYPSEHGGPLPPVNWELDGAVLNRQLDQVEDPAARRHLERELWSFRQAYASVGRLDQVDKLWRTRRQVFPDSTMAGDRLFTGTALRSPIVPPSLLTGAFVWISWGIVIWFGLVSLSIPWMLARLRHAAAPWWEWMIWLAGVPFLARFLPWSTC